MTTMLADLVEGRPLAAFLAQPAVLIPTVLVLSLLIFLRPRRKGGKDAPPMVTQSPVSSVPIFGPAIEFGKSPVKMVKRCYDDYGPVFTVPVRSLFSFGVFDCEKNAWAGLK